MRMITYLHYLLISYLGTALTIKIYVKIDGEFVEVPGDYTITSKTDSQPFRNKRAITSGTVFLNNTLQQKSLAEIFSLYASITDPMERRAVLAPEDAYSVGYCEVKETITWPARCYKPNSSGLHLCRSNARGILEIRGSSCSQQLNMIDLFTKK